MYFGAVIIIQPPQNHSLLCAIVSENSPLLDVFVSPTFDCPKHMLQMITCDSTGVNNDQNRCTLNAIRHHSTDSPCLCFHHVAQQQEFVVKMLNCVRCDLLIEMYATTCILCEDERVLGRDPSRFCLNYVT